MQTKQIVIDPDLMRLVGIEQHEARIPDGYVSAAEWARRANMSVNTIYQRLIAAHRNGLIPRVKVGMTYYYPTTLRGVKLNVR